MSFEELEPISLYFSKTPSINTNVFRVLIYKAFRSYLVRKGFTWDPRRRNEAFITRPSFKLKNEIYEKYRVELISIIVSEDLNNVLYVHEGLRYKLDLIDEVPALIVFPKVTPFIRATDDDIVEKNIIFSCHASFQWKSRGVCKLPRKKMKISSMEYTGREHILCPTNVDKRLVKLVDDKGRNYEIPRHVIHVEAHPAVIRALGYETYKEFRRLALKRTYDRLKTLMALLHYISEGSNIIKISVGDDPEGIIITSTLNTHTIADRSEVWKKYRINYEVK